MEAMIEETVDMEVARIVTEVMIVRMAVIDLKVASNVAKKATLAENALTTKVRVAKTSVDKIAEIEVQLSATIAKVKGTWLESVLSQRKKDSPIMETAETIMVVVMTEEVVKTEGVVETSQVEEATAIMVTVAEAMLGGKKKRVEVITGTRLKMIRNALTVKRAMRAGIKGIKRMKRKVWRRKMPQGGER